MLQLSGKGKREGGGGDREGKGSKNCIQESGTDRILDWDTVKCFPHGQPVITGQHDFIT